MDKAQTTSKRFSKLNHFKAVCMRSETRRPPSSFNRQRSHNDYTPQARNNNRNFNNRGGHSRNQSNDRNDNASNNDQSNRYDPFYRNEQSSNRNDQSSNHNDQSSNRNSRSPVSSNYSRNDRITKNQTRQVDEADLYERFQAFNRQDQNANSTISSPESPLCYPFHFTKEQSITPTLDFWALFSANG